MFVLGSSRLEPQWASVLLPGCQTRVLAASWWIQFPNPNHPRLPVAVGSRAGASWHGLHYNLVTEFGLGAKITIIKLAPSSQVWWQRALNVDGLVSQGIQQFSALFSKPPGGETHCLKDATLIWVLLGWNCGDLWSSEVTSQVRAELRPNPVSGTCSVPFLVISQLWEKAVLSLEVGTLSALSCCWQFKGAECEYGATFEGVSRQFLQWDGSPIPLKRKYPEEMTY